MTTTRVRRSPTPPLEGAVEVCVGGRPVATTAVVVVLLLVVELTVRATSGGWAPPPRFADPAAAVRVEMMERLGQADVVFAGTSMAWQGFDPAAFTDADIHQRTAFNAGLDGAVPPVSGAWLSGYVVPKLAPDTVVWGLSTLDFAPAFGAEALEAWQSAPAGRPGALGTVERAVAEVSETVARRAQLRRPSTLVGDEAAADRAAIDEARRTTGPEGQRLVFDVDRSARRAAVQRARLEGYTPDPTDVRAVIETVLALRQQGADVVLAELPLPPAMVALHPRAAADVASAQSTMRALGDVLAVPFVPITGEWADADFVDFSHLTAGAANRFTAGLAGAIPLPGAGPAPSARPVAVAGDPGAGDTTSVTEPAGAGAVTPLTPPATRGPTPAPPPAPAPAPAPPAPVPAPPLPPAPATAPAPPPPPAPATAAPPVPAPAPQPTAEPRPTTPLSDWYRTPAARAVTRSVTLAAIDAVGCVGGGLVADDIHAAHEAAQQLADRAVGDAVPAVLDAAQTLVTSCGDAAQWRIAMTELLRAVEGLIGPLENALSTTRSAAGAVDHAEAGANARDLAIFLSNAHDRLDWLVDGAGDPRLSRNEVWWSFAQRGHVDALLRRAETGDTIDTIVFGTSQARSGVRAGRLSDRTGRVAFNSGIDGGTIDIGNVWASRFALDAARPRTAVVLVSGIDLLRTRDNGCRTTSHDDFVASLDRASTAFANVPFLAGESPLRLASATDSGTAPPIESPLVVGYRPNDAADYPERDQDPAAFWNRHYIAAYERFQPCDDRMAALRHLVTAVTDRGARAVVIGAPVRSTLRDAAPDGAIASLEAEMAGVINDAGGEFESLTDFLPDDEMLDLVHASRTGADLLTDEIAMILDSDLTGLLDQ